MHISAFRSKPIGPTPHREHIRPVYSNECDYDVDISNKSSMQLHGNVHVLLYSIKTERSLPAAITGIDVD